MDGGVKKNQPNPDLNEYFPETFRQILSLFPFQLWHENRNISAFSHISILVSDATRAHQMHFKTINIILWCESQTTMRITQISPLKKKVFL